jgi:hypothetical protein
LVPGAELVKIDGAGHLLNIDRPEVFNELLRTALYTAERRRRPADPCTACRGNEVGKWWALR